MKILILFLSLFSSLKAVDVDWYMQVEGGLGGDTLGEIKYLYASDDKVDAGDGFGAKIGLMVKADRRSAWSTALSIGIIYDSEDASNGDISYTRYPVNLIEYYTYKSLRVGAGVSYHLNPSVDGSGFAKNADLDMQSKYAPLIEVSYMFSPNIYLGLSFSPMKYSRHDKKIDATRVAAVLGMSIPLYRPKIKPLSPSFKKELTWQEDKKQNPDMEQAHLSAEVIKHAKVKQSITPSIKVKEIKPRRVYRKPMGDTYSRDDDNADLFFELTSSSTSDEQEEKHRIGTEYVPHFVSNNMDILAVEIASGQGETLDTLSALLKVEDKVAFQERLKSAFEMIFDTDVTSDEVTQRIVALRD